MSLETYFCGYLSCQTWWCPQRQVAWPTEQVPGQSGLYIGKPWLEKTTIKRLTFLPFLDHNRSLESNSCGCPEKHTLPTHAHPEGASEMAQCPKHWLPGLISGTHMVGEKRLLQVVLRPPRVQCGVCACTPDHVHRGKQK